MPAPQVTIKKCIAVTCTFIPLRRLFPRSVRLLHHNAANAKAYAFSLDSCNSSLVYHVLILTSTTQNSSTPRFTTGNSAGTHYFSATRQRRDSGVAPQSLCYAASTKPARPHRYATTPLYTTVQCSTHLARKGISIAL